MLPIYERIGSLSRELCIVRGGGGKRREAGGGRGKEPPNGHSRKISGEKITEWA